MKISFFKPTLKRSESKCAGKWLAQPAPGLTVVSTQVGEKGSFRQEMEGEGGRCGVFVGFWYQHKGMRVAPGDREGCEQVRYFVLAGKRLRYYKDQNFFLGGAQAKGEIFLNGSTVVRQKRRRLAERAVFV